MSSVRGRATVSQRMRALQKRALRPDGTRRTGGATTLAERLEHAALLADQDAPTEAIAIALLAVLGIEDSISGREIAIAERPMLRGHLLQAFSDAGVGA